MINNGLNLRKIFFKYNCFVATQGYDCSSHPVKKGTIYQCHLLITEMNYKPQKKRRHKIPHFPPTDQMSRLSFGFLFFGM